MTTDREALARAALDIVAIKTSLFSFCQALAKQIDAAILHADFLEIAERVGLGSPTVREAVRQIGIALTHGGQQKNPPTRPSRASWLMARLNRAWARCAAIMGSRALMRRAPVPESSDGLHD